MLAVHKEVMKSDIQQESELWKETLLLLRDNDLKQGIWEDGVSSQFKEVTGRLIIFQLSLIAEAEPSYPKDLVKELQNLIAELIKTGFYIHCAEEVSIKHNVEDYFDIKPVDDLGLKEYLISRIQPVVDGEQVEPELEPPTYAFNTVKSFWKLWITKVLPDSKSFQALQKDNQAALITRLPLLIITGYIIAVLQGQYHNANNKHSTNSGNRVDG